MNLNKQQSTGCRGISGIRCFDLGGLVREREVRYNQIVERQSPAEQISPEQAVQELIELGFEIRLKELYERYRRAEYSFGYLAQAMGMTTWGLTHLLEERGWPTHNLPS